MSSSPLSKVFEINGFEKNKTPVKDKNSIRLIQEALSPIYFKGSRIIIESIAISTGSLNPKRGLRSFPKQKYKLFEFFTAGPWWKIYVEPSFQDEFAWEMPQADSLWRQAVAGLWDLIFNIEQRVTISKEDFLSYFFKLNELIGAIANQIRSGSSKSSSDDAIADFKNHFNAPVVSLQEKS